MSARLTIIHGPARCGKTERLLACYRDALRDQPPGSTLWLAPNWRAAAEVRDRLFGDGFGGCFSPGVTTFDKFAVDVLRRSGKPLRAIAPQMKRELLRQIISEQTNQGRLNHFRPIADTAGLLDLVCEFIGEFKRLEIWPEMFLDACQKRGLSDKDKELHEIYELYQQALRESESFDKEGRLWSARDELTKIANEKNPLPSSLSSLPSLIIADGFTDFTRTEHEILESLSARAEEMYVTLPIEPAPLREDLFAKPLKTLKELRRRFPEVVVEQLDRSVCPAWPAMAHLERTLFEHPRAKNRSAAADTDVPVKGIEILAAARQIGEIEAVAGRIKRLLVEHHVRADEIAVVFRSTTESADLIREVFGRMQIPFVLEAGQPLGQRPVLRALVKLLQLDLDDWPFEQLLSVVGSNYFQPGWPEWRTADAAELELAIRTMQIPRGRTRLIEQSRLIKPRPSVAPESAGTPESPAATDGRDLIADVFKRLADAFDAMPRRATLAEWGAAWERLAEQTGLFGGREEGGEGRGTKYSAGDDFIAWQRLKQHFDDSETLACWISREQTQLDRPEAVESLLDILGSDRLGNADDETGRVRVLSAASIRSISVPHLFLAGLSEKVFPPPDREDRLYGEAECTRLIEAGLPLVARRERTCEEMLLFYEAATRATERLYLSYPALDEAAQALLPSPFLGEIELAFAPSKITRIEQTELSPVPRDDEPLSTAEFRVKAVATALEGNVALLAGLLSQQWPASLISALDLLHSRQDRERFGPAEGVMQSSAARDRMNDAYSSQHTFSATELERYAYCPFQFFMERILKIEPVEDLALEFDVLNRGRIVHEVLSRFHQGVNARLGRPGSPLQLDGHEFDELMAEAVAGALPPEPANPLQAAMQEIDRRLVVEWMSQYRRQVEKYETACKDFDSPPAPELFEVAFGQPHVAQPPSAVVNGAAQPRATVLQFGDEIETIRISGRIDRVDTGTVAGQTVFNVLDYKTGGSMRFNADTIRAGTTLQLPLYALAAMEILLADRDALPWRAGYWHVRDAGYKSRQALRMYVAEGDRIELEPDWEAIRAGLGDTIAELVRAVRRGSFPVCCGDEYCTGYCPYNTVCRVNHVRALEKTCLPTSRD